MRPKVDYSTKERLVKVARGLDSDLRGRSVPFAEALNVVLGHVEAERAESEKSESKSGESVTVEDLLQSRNATGSSGFSRPSRQMR